MLAPVGLSPLWPLVVGLALLLIGRRSSLAPWQSLRVVVEPLLLMLVALPSVSINLLSSNEWMHQVNVSHHSVPGVPFFVLAGILGAAGVRSQLQAVERNRPGLARVAGAGIPSLDLLPVVRREHHVSGLYLPRDGHFSVRGNRVAGRAIGRWLAAEGLVPDAAGGS